jgi:hypothetical protein
MEISKEDSKLKILDSEEANKAKNAAPTVTKAPVKINTL